MSVLALRGITVRYGRTTVIDGLDWTVGGDRLVTALLGPSGCGKSTLLRAIAGLEPPAAGTLTWDGADLRHVPVHRRDFGVVFQDGQLFSGRTVAQNIAYGLRLRRWPRARIAERVDEMLALVQLPGAGDRRVTDLSGGQAQRVALARALAPRPRLLLLDEPLAALDARLREELAFAIGDIVRAARTPAVVVTHDRAEAALIADEVSVMHDGAIIQTAPPDRLWRRPADDWVAGFLGATLLLDADVTAGRLRTPFGSVSAAGVDGLAGDGPCRVALRPESLRAEPTPNGDAPEATGTVTHAAALPSGIRLRVRTATSEVDALASSPVGVGDRVRLVLDPAQVAVIGR